MSYGTDLRTGKLIGAMKIIFLDIDGVLNSSKTPNPRKLPYIVDKKLLGRLLKLVERSGAKIVLSSSWRIDPIGVYAARYWGIPVFDICPDFPKRPRCKEILAWLKGHPGVIRYVVIDDEDDDLDQLPLFQPSARTGLTMDVVHGVQRYLDGKTEYDMRLNVIERVGQNIHSLFKHDKS